MATSGLKIRATQKGKKILTIPYNAQFDKINDGKSYSPLTVTEIKELKTVIFKCMKCQVAKIKI